MNAKPASPTHVTPGGDVPLRPLKSQRVIADGPKVTIGQSSSAGRKTRNDDSYGVLIPEGPSQSSQGIAMAIADGMSSSTAAKEASETCVKSFLEDYYATHESWTVKTAVERVLTALNRWLYTQSLTQPTTNDTMVSTFSGVILKAGVAHLFHVGDSRIYLVRDDTIEQLTSDHRIRNGPNQEYLARALGADARVEVDYSRMAAVKDDLLVFTTDGVHDYVDGRQILDILRASSDDLTLGAEMIVNAGLAKGSPDNLTCQIVRVDEPGIADERTYLQHLAALPFPPILEAGMSFEGYQILRELHASKKTQIYLAVDLETGQQVALKTPAVSFEDDPVYIELFTREEWVGQLLSSPHVLKVLRPARLRRFLYYVTEYIDGKTLRQWMRDNRSPDVQTVRVLVEQIATGLRAFQRKEIVHQDLKPENILIDRNGTVRIIDFGSCRVAGIAEAGSPISAPALLGTESYTAPEVIRGEKATHSADIFSLGVITYEMLTGKLPYATHDFLPVRGKAMRPYIPAAQHNPRLPAWVDAALKKAVDPKPSARYDALSAFLQDLTRPNPTLENRTKPLIERDPTRFWRFATILLLLANLILILALAR